MSILKFNSLAMKLTVHALAAITLVSCSSHVEQVETVSTPGPGGNADQGSALHQNGNINQSGTMSSAFGLPRARIAKHVVQTRPYKNARVQPNILWILTDDQRVDSVAAVNRVLRGTSESALGYVESPNLDALASEGVLFTHAYNQSPGCAPSRYSMATGQYPHRSGVYGFEYTHQVNPNAQQTIPQILRKHGYQTMLAGKEGLRIKGFGAKNTRPADPLIYDYEVERYALTRAGLGDWGQMTIGKRYAGKSADSVEFFNFPDGSQKTFPIRQPGDSSKRKTGLDDELEIVRSYTRRQKDLIIAGESPMPGDKTLDGLILGAFTQYIANANGQYTSVLGDKIVGPDTSRPAMISLSFGFPHTPVLPPKSFRDRFKNRTYKIPEFSKEELKKLPPQLVKLYQNLKIDGLTYDEKQRAIRDYYAFTAYGDSLIGEALEAFKAYSKRSNRPYIILMTVGDHGWHLGEQGIEAKFAPWNSSGQGALIAVDSSGEYFPRNTVHTEFVEYVDIAPTLLAAAGVDLKTQTQLDGFDLADIIRQPKLKRDYALGELNQIVGDRAYLRSERYAFSMRIRPKDGKPGETHAPGEDILWAVKAPAQAVDMALYDMACDPNERNNVAYRPEYKEVTDALRKKTQDIFLGDKRLEIDWKKADASYLSDFAIGANDRRLPARLSHMAKCSNG